LAKYARAAITDPGDAVDFSCESGAALYRTSRVLRLDYARLKAQLGPGPTDQVKSTSAFVEFVAAGSPECVVELENARGKKMRIQLRGVASPDLAELSRMFWSSKA
jgi:hypothetical protein